MFNGPSESSRDPAAPAGRSVGQHGSSDSRSHGLQQADIAVAAPSITLPKGGGAIRGIGEKFGANPVNGTATLTVPICDDARPIRDSGHSSPSRTTPALATARSASAGRSACRRSPARPTRGCRTIATRTSPTSSSSPAPKTSCRSARRWQPLAVTCTTAPGVTDRTLIGHASRDSSHASSAGPASQWHRRSLALDHARQCHHHLRPHRGEPDRRSSGPGTHLLLADLRDRTTTRETRSVYQYARGRTTPVSSTPALQRAATAVRTANRVPQADEVRQPPIRSFRQTTSRPARWLFEAVFDYDEGHYADLPVPPPTPHGDDRPRVRASATATSAWTVRPDSFSSHRAGFEVRTYRRCHRVLMFHAFDTLTAAIDGEPYLVRATELRLRRSRSRRVSDPPPTSSLIRAARDSPRSSGGSPSPGTRRTPAAHAGPERRTLRALPQEVAAAAEFEYSRPTIQDDVRELDRASLEEPAVRPRRSRRTTGSISMARALRHAYGAGRRLVLQAESRRRHACGRALEHSRHRSRR